MSAAFDLRGFCSDEAGLDGVNLHASISGTHSHLAGGKLGDIPDFFLRRSRFCLGPLFGFVLRFKQHRVQVCFVYYWRTFRDVGVMSALPLKADIDGSELDDCRIRPIE